jgi:DNA repair protein RecN (Recombination protein N)
VLEELRLRGLGVIDEAVLELGPGFVVVTGETGAGKTMVLTGLNLLFGARADAGLVRAGARAAVVEGRVRIDPDGEVAAAAAEAGAELDDGSLIIARTVGADGRSRAHLGGRSVPLAVVGALADDLIAVHGQADQRGLLRPSVQRDLLDRYGGAATGAARAHYRELFDRVSAVRAELVEVTTRARERAQEADLLRFGVAEIEAVAPLAGEDAALRAEAARLGAADDLRTAAGSAHRALNSGDADGADVLAMLGAARRALDAVAGRDQALDALTVRLADATYLLADVAADLASYAGSVEADPLRLEAVQTRLAQLGALTRKYADSVDGVIAWAEQANRRLGVLDGDDERAVTLGAEHERLLADLAGAAARLSAARLAAAARLTAAAEQELAALALPHATLQVDVRRRPDPSGLLVALDGSTDRVAFGASGIDDVEFQLSPHRGSQPRPLHRGASGGELSRVMLALEVVLAGMDPVPTFVFDEVDAGVGGTAAVEVGRRLARLAETAQVLVVTHLPQVAAFADRHLVVRKNDDGRVTTSDVVAVEGEERLQELTRMLAGLPDSELGRGHAEELLAVAAAAKPSA